MTYPSHIHTLAVGLTAVALWGCTPKTDSAAPPAATGLASPASPASAPTAAASAPVPAAPVSITTVKAQKRDMPVLIKATGTVMPLASVDVKSQATSVVSKIHFQEGQFVKVGQLLFTLDARTDEANTAKARAQLAKDSAAQADAQRQFARTQQLFSQSYVSQGAVDTARALVESMAATVNADQAAIDASSVALTFARITAPIAGRAGAVAVSVGSAVLANQTNLVTVTQLNPIAVAFSVPQRNLTDALSALAGGGAEVTAQLADGGGSFQGHLKFVDNAVDPNSGTVKVKAVFDNQKSKLWPGAFVELSQTLSTIKDAVVVPQASIIQGARGSIVYVVENGKAVLRPVKVLYAQGVDAAVSGVKPGEPVVLDGKQNLRPNSLVTERARETKPGTP